MKLCRGGVGVVVAGAGARVRLELREFFDEAIEVLVHSSARLDKEDRHLLVLPAFAHLHLCFLCADVWITKPRDGAFLKK